MNTGGTGGSSTAHLAGTVTHARVVARIRRQCVVANGCGGRGEGAAAAQTVGHLGEHHAKHAVNEAVAVATWRTLSLVLAVMMAMRLPAADAPNSGSLPTHTRNRISQSPTPRNWPL